VMSRQNDGGESEALSEERIEIAASSLQQTSARVQQSIEQMVWSGTEIDDLLFMPSTDPTFEDRPFFAKVFHPQGGGVSLPPLRAEVAAQIDTDPPAGWYLGRFNNVSWTDSAGDDVILSAHQIRRDVCARINERLTGSPTIPTLGGETNQLLFSSAVSTASSNIEFSSANCADCFGWPSLCVRDDDTERFTYYNIIIGQ